MLSKLWFVRRFLGRGWRKLGSTAIFAVFAMSLGVGSLVVAMSVVSGFESSLRKAVIDVTGHLVIFKRTNRYPEFETLSGLTQRIVDEELAKRRSIWNSFLESPHNEIVSGSFIIAEGIAAFEKKVVGVIAQGLSFRTMTEVLRLEPRLVQGRLFSDDENQVELSKNVPAVLGQGLSRRLGVSVGDQVSLVVPLPHRDHPNRLRRRLLTMRVEGLVDLGKFELDERYVFLPQAALENLLGVPDAYNGVVVRLPNDDLSEPVALRLAGELDLSMSVRQWRDGSQNLFRAVEIEKRVIFFVLLLLVLAASVNVAVTLYIAVLQRFSDIGLLKAMGASSGWILRVFSLQGVVLGIVGVMGGYLIGGGLSYAFLYIERTWGILPSDIYKVTFVETVFSWKDLVLIGGTALGICSLATFAPARRGSQLEPVEGLHYE